MPKGKAIFAKFLVKVQSCLAILSESIAIIDSNTAGKSIADSDSDTLVSKVSAIPILAIPILSER